MCICNGQSLPTSSFTPNYQVVVPIDILMNVLCANNFSNNYLTLHIIDNVTKNLIGILLHKKHTYLKKLCKQFNIPFVLQFYVYNRLFVLMPASENEAKLHVLKKLSTDLKIMDDEQSNYLSQSAALFGRQLMISDGGIIEKIIDCEDAEIKSIQCWIDIEQLPDPSQWENKLARLIEDRGVDPESCCLTQKREYLLNGTYFLWKTLLVSHCIDKLILTNRAEYNDNILLTETIDRDIMKVTRFRIKVPKNTIQNVKIIVKYRDGHLHDVAVPRMWMERFPLTISDWSLLKNNKTAVFRVCGIDSTLSVAYIKMTIQNHRSEHFNVDNVIVNYKSYRKHFDADRIQNTICNNLRADMNPVYKFSVYIDTKQCDTNIIGTIDTSPSKENDLEARISNLKFREEKVRYSTIFMSILQVRNYEFENVAPKIKFLKDCLKLYVDQSSSITDFVTLKYVVETDELIDDKCEETLSKFYSQFRAEEINLTDQSLLKSRKGIKMLSAICHKYSTLVEIKDGSMFLYGSDAASAAHDVMQYQAEECEREWKILYVKDIEPSIKTAIKMSILLKTCVRRERNPRFTNMTYNYDLLIVATGMTDVYIDLQSSAIKYTGSETATDELQSLLKQKLLEYQQMIAIPPNTDVTYRVECISCFMPVVNSLYHSLHRCGHLYCHECLLLLLEVASQSKSFPLTCAAEECNSRISWLDVEDIYYGDQSGQEQLINASLANFVVTKPSEGFFCHQADCSGLLLRSRVDINTTKKTNCANCHTSYCIVCKVPYHEGQSCSEYKMSRMSIEHHLRDWLKEKKDNRKLCPHCDSGIEKNGGCDMVYCIHCKMHICWMCLDYFSDSEDAYSHLQRQHDSTL